jgi:hypothetical protein
MTWLQFKTAVKTRLSDLTPTDDLFAEACALYVKSRIAREVDHDLQGSKSYWNDYRMRRNQLVGFVTTLVVGSTLDTQVKRYLPVDATREGITDYVTAQIKLAAQDITSLNALADTLITESVIDIQTFIPCYRVGVETIYTTSNVSSAGNMSRGPVPLGASLKEAWWIEDIPALAITTYEIGDFVSSNGRTYQVISDGTPSTISGGLVTTDGTVETLGGVKFVFFYGEDTFRSPMQQLRWHDRFKLNYRRTGCAGRDYPAAIMVDPESYSFYTWPIVDSTHSVSLVWSGAKTNFANGDTVPFDESLIVAVKEYVLSRLLIQTDDGVNMAKIHAASYVDKRAQLFAECTRRVAVQY